MKQKDIITSSISIFIGLVLILTPFITDLKRSLILLGIVPLWMGIYIIYNTLRNDIKNKE